MLLLPIIFILYSEHSQHNIPSEKLSIFFPRPASDDSDFSCPLVALPRNTIVRVISSFLQLKIYFQLYK